MPKRTKTGGAETGRPNTHGVNASYTSTNWGCRSDDAKAVKAEAECRLHGQLARPRFRGRKLIIAIDGPAGSGKSSTAKALAIALHLPYVDSGAMYRAVTLKAMQQGISFDSNFHDNKKLVKIAKSCRIRLTTSPKGVQKVYLDGKDVTGAIREPALTQNVFHIAQEPQIRREMVKKQKAMGKKDGAVMEGRDIGTVVFPKADYKFYFEARPDVRAKRRQRDLVHAGKKMSIQKVLKDIKFRDQTDYNRKEGPLKRAKDAILIDTSSLTIGQTVDRILQFVKL